MEAVRLQTLSDLLASPEERVELIDGEIVRRPMARAEHGTAQSNTADELGPFKRRTGPGGWWILTEVSVSYEAHQCPSHDLAGWRNERLPERPRGIIEPDLDGFLATVGPEEVRGSDGAAVVGLHHRAAPREGPVRRYGLPTAKPL